MRDGFGREIDYLRVSITDRCNLRCRYCMPEGARFLPEGALLSFDELLRVCRAATALGVSRFKVTGGEPLVRPGAVEFMRSLSALPGAESVTLTTNGLLLEPLVAELGALDGVNVSLDSSDSAAYAALTGVDAAERVLRAIRRCAEAGIRTKVNCVLLSDVSGAARLAHLAEALPVDVRYIRLMPVGMGGATAGAEPEAVLALLRQRWSDLHSVDEIRGNGPARYFASARLAGRIGLIDAVSHRFCDRCNRIRLTADGRLRPCLCYADSIDLKSALRDGATDGDVVELLEQAIRMKPLRHAFDGPGGAVDRQPMSRIGG